MGERPDSCVRYLDQIRDLLTLPVDHQERGKIALLLEVLRRRIVEVEEGRDTLWAEVQHLRPIASAMKLVDQISDQRREIAHLQRQVERMTGAYTAWLGNTLKVEGKTGIAGAREDLERLRDKGHASACECLHCITARGAVEGEGKWPRG